MLETYENIYIGDFIFYLGYLAGQNNLSFVNKNVFCMKKNSEHTVLEDILQKWKGKNYIIVFKRTEAYLQKVLQQEHQLALLKSFDTNKSLLHIANKSHFIGFGVIKDEIHDGDNCLGCQYTANEDCDESILRAGDLIFMPYSNLSSLYNSKLNIQPCMNLQHFCENLLIKQANNFGASFEELQKYIYFIQEINKKVGYYSESNSENGIILNVSEDNVINLLPFNDSELLHVVLDHPMKTSFGENGIEGYSVG